MNKQEIKEHILMTLSTLRDRPKVILSGENNYYSCRIFIDGYFWGLKNDHQLDLANEISFWLAKKYDAGSAAAPYSLYPEYFHKEETDDKKKEILLKLIEEYVTTRM